MASQAVADSSAGAAAGAHLDAEQRVQRGGHLVGAALQRQLAGAGRRSVHQHRGEVAQGGLGLGGCRAAPRQLSVEDAENMGAQRNHGRSDGLVCRELGCGAAHDLAGVGRGGDLVERRVQADRLEVEQLNTGDVA